MKNIVLNKYNFKDDNNGGGSGGGVSQNEQISNNTVLDRKTVHNNRSVLAFKGKSKPSIQKTEKTNERKNERTNRTETAEQLRIGFNMSEWKMR